MSHIITTPKVHHFRPLAWSKVEQVRMPLMGDPDSLPERRRANLAEGITSYTFQEGFAPTRVDDILLVDTESGRVLPNREAPRPGPKGVVVFGRLLYEYDLATRTITFHQPLEKSVQMHWYCMHLDTTLGRWWHKVSMTEFLIQGSNYVDQNLIPPDEPNLTGKYQGSWRCMLEIVSLPRHGLVRMSPDMLGFAYRGRFGFTGLDSFEYLVYNSLGQVSDTCCITIQSN